MKWNIFCATLVLSLGLCTQGFSFELLNRLLGGGGYGCDAGCCAQPNDCGCDNSCGCDKGCGCATACGCEKTCGCERTCGCESSCGCDTGCGCSHGGGLLHYHHVKICIPKITLPRIRLCWPTAGGCDSCDGGCGCDNGSCGCDNGGCGCGTTTHCGCDRGNGCDHGCGVRSSIGDGNGSGVVAPPEPPAPVVDPSAALPRGRYIRPTYYAR